MTVECKLSNKQELLVGALFKQSPSQLYARKLYEHCERKFPEFQKSAIQVSLQSLEKRSEERQKSREASDYMDREN